MYVFNHRQIQVAIIAATVKKKNKKKRLLLWSLGGTTTSFNFSFLIFKF